MNDAHFRMTIELPCGHTLVHKHVVTGGGIRYADVAALKEASGVFGHWLLYALPRHRCELVTKQNQYGLTLVDSYGIVMGGKRFLRKRGD